MAKKNVAENTTIEETVVSKEVKETKKTAVVKNCEKLNLRERPSTNASVIEVLSKNDSVVVKNKVDNVWTHVATKTGVNGYVMSEFIS